VRPRKVKTIRVLDHTTVEGDADSKGGPDAACTSIARAATAPDIATRHLADVRGAAQAVATAMPGDRGLEAGRL
jgi:hypothetical protein